MKTASLLSLLMTLVPATTLAQGSSRAPAPVVQGDLGRRLDDHLSRLAAYGMSGSILIERNGEVILHKGYGTINRETGEPVTTATPFILASLSKQFTATAILKLETQGKLKVSDTVGRFFPDAPADKAGITIDQLLSHTSGLPYLGTTGLFDPMEREGVMEEVLGLKLDFPPGERAAYSSPGYTLLAGIVEKASGETFEIYLRKNLFEPAGMSMTRFQGEPGTWEGMERVHSYSGSNDEGPIGSFGGADKGVGAGTVISTTGDLYKWELALRNNTVLSKEATDKLFAPHAESGGPFKHAYGWNVTNTPRNTRLIFHAGDFGGYNTEMRRYVDEGLTVIFTSNMRVDGPGYRQAVMNGVSLLIAGVDFPRPPAVARVAPDALQGHTGTYRLATGGTVTVRADGERLHIAGEGQDAISSIFGAGSADSGKQEFLNGRASEILTGAAKGDYGWLLRNLHPSLPPDAVEQGSKAWWGSRRDSLGEFRGVTILGTGTLSQNAAKTYYRIDFARGSSIGMFGWGGGKIMAIDQDLPVAGETLFLPESSESAASFDMFTGRSVHARFSASPGREPSRAVIFQNPDGEVRAERISG